MRAQALTELDGRVGGPAAEAEPAPAATRRAGAARGAHAVLVALAVLGCLHALFLLGVEGWRYRATAKAVQRLETSVRGLEDEAAGLQAVIDHADDPRYREDLARLQGYMYPDEERAVTQGGAAPSPTSP